MPNNHAAPKPVRKTVMYQGKEVEVEDCTPTWSAIIDIHINGVQRGVAASIEEVRRMATELDKANEYFRSLKS